ncbi:hypothetical protein ACFQZ1_25410 [Bacillus sp. CGMCC 1.60114]|uniref:hypothetical protein n=1 Tax=unclassified Bacillus (in: firmicutes) TaxID=185979 RepID=UPI00363C8CA9
MKSYEPKKGVFLFSFSIVMFIVADRDQKMLLTAAEIKRSIQTKFLLLEVRLKQRRFE